jgi:hypothetical protein
LPGMYLYFQIKRVLVSDRTILAIKQGTSLDEARKTLGIAARHEFTVSQPDGTYTLISCLGPDPDGTHFLYLFHNQAMEKMISFPRAELERFPYRGTTASRIKPWAVDDQTRIIKAIAAPAWSQTDIIRALKPNPYTGPGESWDLVPAALFVGIATAGPIQFRFMNYERNEYRVNFDYLSRYDGCKASLGMSGEEVEAMFGKPLRVFSGKDGEIVRIFGRTKIFEVNTSCAFSGMAIVIDAQDRVIAVYRDGFFNHNWAGRSESY